MPHDGRPPAEAAVRRSAEDAAARACAEQQIARKTDRTAVAEVRALDVVVRDGVPMYSCTLPRVRESAAVARRVVADLLGLWGLPGLVDDAVLVVDELVANAADHARGASIRGTVSRMECGVVRVAVVDMDRKYPRPVDAGPDDEGGRGMYLVAGLSQRWGVDPLNWGKRVWADVAVAP